jgi:hypothetical protein
MKTRGKKSRDTVPLKRKAVLSPGRKAPDFKQVWLLTESSFNVSPDKAKVPSPKKGGYVVPTYAA